MLQTAPFGRALPMPPVVSVDADVRANDDDVACAKLATPRPREAVEQLAGRIVSPSQLVKYWIVWGSVAFALWIAGTAIALVLGKLVLVLGFGGLGGGLAAGYLWTYLRRREAQTLARGGQLVRGIATHRRHEDSFSGELRDMLATSLAEKRCCIVFSIGFIKHELWVAFPSEHDEGERLHVLVQPGARVALAFDAQGRGHVGELHRVG
jgi:hypothetical protein